MHQRKHIYNLKKYIWMQAYCYKEILIDIYSGGFLIRLVRYFYRTSYDRQQRKKRICLWLNSCYTRGIISLNSLSRMLENCPQCPADFYQSLSKTEQNLRNCVKQKHNVSRRNLFHVLVTQILPT